MPAEELHRLGYLTDLVPDDQMESTVRRYTDAAQQTEPTVIGQMKAHMLEIANTMHTNDQLHQRMQQAYHASVKSPALAARVSAMLSKSEKGS